MTFINYASRQINCKIVYYGPTLSGKTDNLRFIYEKVRVDAKGRLISLATGTDATLFFDFIPLELGNVRGFKTRLHLYTVPQQVFYDAPRRLILKGVDGVVFVADSRRERMEANLESLESLQRNLEEQGYDIRSVPYVLQLNRRDSPTAMPVDEMEAMLRLGDEPMLEAIAHSKEGIGVFDTLKAVARLVLEDLTTGGASVRTSSVPARPPLAKPAPREAPPVPEPVRPSSGSGRGGLRPPGGALRCGADADPGVRPSLSRRGPACS